MDLGLFPRATLERLDREIPSGDLHREWMTPYVYAHKNIYRVYNLEAPRDLTGYRLTLDYPQDLELLTKVFDHFGERHPSTYEILEYLDAHPEVRDLVKGLIDTTVVSQSAIRSQAYQDLVDTSSGSLSPQHDSNRL
jgi:spore coat polysaccharide biosynthesis protein SpsF